MRRRPQAKVTSTPSGVLGQGRDAVAEEVLGLLAGRAQDAGQVAAQDLDVPAGEVGRHLHQSARPSASTNRIAVPPVCICPQLVQHAHPLAAGRGAPGRGSPRRCRRCAAPARSPRWSAGSRGGPASRRGRARRCSRRRSERPAGHGWLPLCRNCVRWTQLFLCTVETVIAERKRSSDVGGVPLGRTARPTRGPKPALSLERIADAAIAVADTEGLAGASPCSGSPPSSARRRCRSTAICRARRSWSR